MNLYEELKIIKEDSNEIFGKLFIDENTNEFKISSTNGITIQDLNVENLNISSQLSYDIYWQDILNKPSPTITLSGSINGSGTLTELGDVTISQTVQNDSHTHDSRYYKKTQLNTTGNVDDQEVHWGNLTNVPSFSLDTHLHDDRYYTETEVDGFFTSHTGIQDAHHSRYTDSEAVSAVQAQDDYVKNTGDTITGNLAITGTVDGIDISQHAGNQSAHHSRYTDSEAITAINGDANHSSSATHSYTDLTNKPSIAYSTTIAADDFTQTEVNNLRQAKLDDGTTPWTQKLDQTHAGQTGTAHGVVTTSVNGFMSQTDKVKLNGIQDSANNYTHPQSHPATMISLDTTHRFVTDTQITTWDAKPDYNTWRPIDDSPVNGVTTESISSNWAYDHNANQSAHHSRYTDSEAISAVQTQDDYVKNTGDTITGNLSITGNSITSGTTTSNNGFETGNYKIEHNQTTDSLDFNYIG